MSKFWETKTLSEMSLTEWESLCDGCGRCCLVQLQNDDDEQLYETDVACRLFDGDTCRCRDYKNRSQKVATCMVMDKDNIALCVPFAPPTCAYRLLHEGRPLFPWHPLISGDPNSVDVAGISVRGKTVSVNDVPVDELEEHIVDWF